MNISVVYYNDLLYLHYKIDENSKNKNIPSSDKFIENYKESLKRDIESQTRAINRNKKDLQPLIKKRNNFKKNFPEFYL